MCEQVWMATGNSKSFVVLYSHRLLLSHCEEFWCFVIKLFQFSLLFSRSIKHRRSQINLSDGFSPEMFELNGANCVPNFIIVYCKTDPQTPFMDPLIRAAERLLRTTVVRGFFNDVSTPVLITPVIGRQTLHCSGTGEHPRLTWEILISSPTVPEITVPKSQHRVFYYFLAT